MYKYGVIQMSHFCLFNQLAVLHQCYGGTLNNIKELKTK